MLAFDNMTPIIQLAPHSVHTDFMLRFCRPDECWGRDSCFIEKLNKMSGVFITHDLRWVVAERNCSFLYFQSMLVCTDREKWVIFLELAKSMEGITIDSCIQVTDMGLCIHVEYRRHNILSPTRATELPQLELSKLCSQHVVTLFIYLF